MCACMVTHLRVALLPSLGIRRVGWPGLCRPGQAPVHPWLPPAAQQLGPQEPHRPGQAGFELDSAGVDVFKVRQTSGRCRSGLPRHTTTLDLDSKDGLQDSNHVTLFQLFN